MNKSIIAIAVSATLLAACGGSDDNNEAPVLVADSAVTLNGDAVSIDVLANDTDPESDALTVSAVSMPDVGEAAIIDNEIVYTPTTLAMGEVSFSYDVTDGENTVSSTVTITNQQSVSISSIATDAPLANAEVTALDMGGNVIATTQAGADGRFTLPITVSAAPGDLTLSAVGTEEQAQVTLSSRVGDFTTMRNLSIENNTDELTSDLFPASKITHVSTAMDILYSEYKENGGEGSFDTFASEVDFEKVLGLASFIKVLADNSDFPVPEGMSTLTFFTGSLVDVLSTIREYVNSLGLLNEDGTYAQAYIEALNRARAETLEDEALRLDYANGDVAGSEFVVYDGGNFQSIKGTKVLTFNENGNGVSTSSDLFASNIADNFSWSVEDGKIKIVFVDAEGSTSYPLLSDELLAYFDEGTQAKLLELYETGTFSQWELTRKIVSTEISLLSVTGSNALASELNTYKLLLKPAGVENPEEFEATFTETGDMAYHNGDYIQLTRDKVLETPWVLNIQDILTIDNPFDENGTISEEGMIADRFTFNANGTYETWVTGESGMWTLENGALQLQYRDSTFKFSPFKVHNDYLLALLEFGDEGKTIKYTVDMHKVRGSVDTTQLVSELPVAWLSYVFDHEGPDGLPLYNDVFGYYFLQNGTAGRIYPNSNEDEASFATDYDTYHWQWAVVDNVVIIEGQIGSDNWMLRRQRKWHVLGETEDGRMMVIENFILYWDEQNPYADVILPRLNFYKKLDLAVLYPDQWERFSVTDAMESAFSKPVSISYSSQSIAF